MDEVYSESLGFNLRKWFCGSCTSVKTSVPGRKRVNLSKGHSHVAVALANSACIRAQRTLFAFYYSRFQSSEEGLRDEVRRLRAVMDDLRRQLKESEACAVNVRFFLVLNFF